MKNAGPNTTPNAFQTLLAAVIGIGIGLGASWYIDHQAPGGRFSSANIKATIKKFTPANLNMNVAAAVSNSFPTLSKRTNILLMGVDSNGRHCKRFLNTRSDTMILASLDPVTQTVGLVSIPRDSRIRIADDHGLDKINSAHALGGPELAVKTVQEAFGVPIDHYMVIDTQGLKSVCEIVGPIEVLVEKRMRYRDRASGLTIDLEPGLQQLSAAQVEEYCRFRHDQKGDLGRIERQQWFLRQAARKLKEPSVVLKLPEIVKFANEYVVTDLSVADMAQLVGFGKSLKESQISTAMLPGEARMIKGGSYYIPDPEGAALVFSRLTGASPSVSLIASATRSEREQAEEIYGLNQEDALAYEEDSYSRRPSNDTLQAAWAASCADGRPFRVVIRYPQGQDETARDFEESLTEAGYQVVSKQRCKTSDCQHEQIVLNSFRADDNMTRSLKDRFPELASFAVVLNPVSRTRIDATIQIAPDTIPLLPHETAGDFDSKDINGEVKASKLPGPKLPNS